MRPRFVVDLNVERVAKWLWVMSYDALFVPEADGGQLLKIAGEQNRILVTKDRYILERRVVTTGKVKAFLITSDDFREQFRQVTQALELNSYNVFSLCIECNQRLEGIDRQLVAGRIPAFVFSTQEQFYRCPGCDKLYWRATHWNNMRSELAGFVREA